jgi:hypothetical protein
MKLAQIPVRVTILVVILALLTPIVLVVAAITDSDIPVLVWAAVCLVLSAILVLPSIATSTRTSRLLARVLDHHKDARPIARGVLVDGSRLATSAFVVVQNGELALAVEDSSTEAGLRVEAVGFIEDGTHSSETFDHLAFRSNSGTIHQFLPIQGLFAQPLSAEKAVDVIDTIRLIAGED